MCRKSLEGLTRKCFWHGGPRRLCPGGIVLGERWVGATTWAISPWYPHGWFSIPRNHHCSHGLNKHATNNAEKIHEYILSTWQGQDELKSQAMLGSPSFYGLMVKIMGDLTSPLQHPAAVDARWLWGSPHFWWFTWESMHTFGTSLDEHQHQLCCCENQGTDGKTSGSESPKQPVNRLNSKSVGQLIRFPKE